MADTKVFLSGGRIQGRSDDTLDTPATTTTDGSDTILTFTESGTFTPAGSFNVEYLVVGGGGSGGTANATANSEAGGGGGAGGYQANGTQDHAVTAQTYTITVGTGGASQASAVTAGSNGTSSIFSSITSIGGGAGGSGTNGAGASGGSGGGSGAGTSAQAGGGSSSNGNNGGAGTNQARGGGGGGAGAVGVSGSTVASGRGSNGGAGVANDITGSSLYYAGGGGSGAYDSTDGIGSLGGSSVGGNGGGGEPSDPSAQAGTANTGSGGGGTGRAYLPSGAGATGVVIIRFTTSGNSYTSSVGVGVDKSKTSITNVPAGTRYEETDTRKIFHNREKSGSAGSGNYEWVEKGSTPSSVLRGLFGGSYSSDGKAVKYIVVSTTGTVTSFGNLTNARGLGYACASITEGRALFAGGYGGANGDGSGSDVNWQNIDYFTVASAGNATDFGDLNVAKRGGAGFGSQTRGIFAGGYN
jgi:hypothetical protein